MVGGSYWFSDTIAIKAARAVPVTEAQMPEYYPIVRDLTQRSGMPMPKLYVTPDRQPNAFATGRNPNHAAVAVTEGILAGPHLGRAAGRAGPRAQPRRQPRHPHRLGGRGAGHGHHLRRPHGLLAGRSSVAAGDDGENILELLALVILAPLAAVLLQMALSRSREYEADRSGARLIGDGEPLARALAKIDAGRPADPDEGRPGRATLYIINPLTGRKVAFKNLFITHPPTDDRIARLRSGEWRR